MLYLGEDEMTQVMGIGYAGEVRQGPDGNVYQWVQGVDGLGNPIGFWKKLKRFAKKAAPFIRKVMPLARQFAPFIPGVGPAVAMGLKFATPFLRQALPIAQQVAPLIPGGAAALTAATPLLRQAGVAGAGGLGALYQAPDGSVYQVQGFAEEEELQGLGQEELTQVMGIGYLGEVRQGPDGLYQWVQGVDGLGNPIGFWKKLKRLAKKALPFVRKAMPWVQRFAPFIPGVGPAVAAGLKVASPFLKQAGVLGGDALGALYQAPDGGIYQVQGFAEDEELRGLAEDEELRGLAEDEELRGFAEDEELRGFAEEEELRGFAEDEELRGLAEDEELRGLDQGYVREEGTSGFEAYVPAGPPETRWFVPPAQPPKMWEPPW